MRCCSPGRCTASRVPGTNVCRPAGLGSTRLVSWSCRPGRGGAAPGPPRAPAPRRPPASSSSAVAAPPCLRPLRQLRTWPSSPRRRDLRGRVAESWWARGRWCTPSCPCPLTLCLIARCKLGKLVLALHCWYWTTISTRSTTYKLEGWYRAIFMHAWAQLVEVLSSSLVVHTKAM